MLPREVFQDFDVKAKPWCGSDGWVSALCRSASLGVKRPEIQSSASAHGNPRAQESKGWQALVAGRLGGAMCALVHELTGQHLRVWWRRVADLRSGDVAALCPAARRRLGRPLSGTCERCLRKRWVLPWDQESTEARFSGLCGSINFCASFKSTSIPLVVCVLQARAPVSRRGKEGFGRAVKLTRLMLHDVNATLAAGRGAGGVFGCSCAATFRGAVAGEATVNTSTRGHVRRIVGRMLEHVHACYSQPMQLKDMAAMLKMNASYLCSLFSGATGVTFHRYLEDLRLTKAKALLGDPTFRVREIASLVGYSNPNHFRAVFKGRLGISPSAWRNRSALPAGRASV
jgi:AraC-like DNA-binding protein